MPRPTLVTIDLTALAHNARVARTLAGAGRLMAAVKADAYGHGLIDCVHTLAPLVDGFAVAVCEEARLIRQAGITCPILIMEGPFDLEDLACIESLDLWTVIHSEEQMGLLHQSPPDSRRSIWLKVDTGMHRLGIDPDRLGDVLTSLAELGLTDVTLMSHLAQAEDPDSALSRRQLDRWHRLLAGQQAASSLLNSAGLINHIPSASDWVRPGYMLYGGRPTQGDPDLPTRAVMQFTSEVIALRGIGAGETVGYVGRWQAPRPSVIATIPAGYGDGYPCTAEDGTPVWIDGQLCPLVGRVSMDMITVDVTDHPGVTVGSPVELWGSRLPVDTIARHANTIGYELLTRMPSRARRRIIATK